MSVPIFVDLQGFLVGRHFVVKELLLSKMDSNFLIIIFGCSVLWDSLIKAERHQAMWLRIVMGYNGRMGWNSSILHD